LRAKPSTPRESGRSESMQMVMICLGRMGAGGHEEKKS